ncbi:MAG: hypothetical protein MR380_01795 [Lachnospiraceae bacterium]|nr:hypothetical protein [Lachnospiraceae bacterium]
MPYIPPEVVAKAKEMDLLTYFKNYEPNELVHFAALYCLICSCGVIISKGLLSLSIANKMLHTLCATAPS